MRWLVLVFLLLVPLEAKAQSPHLLTVDLAQKRIDITTGFHGAELSVYGVKKDKGDIAITVVGPSQSMVVRRKSRVLGVWMNSSTFQFDNVPVYYDLALSRPENLIAPYETRHHNDIGIDSLSLEPRDDRDEAVTDTFREALVRNRQGQKLFPAEPEKVAFLEEDFFHTSFYLPANVPTGVYTVHAYLIRDGEVIDAVSTELKVAQTGVSANIYLFAVNDGLAYGLVSVLLALLFGWGAQMILRRD